MNLQAVALKPLDRLMSSSPPHAWPLSRTWEREGGEGGREREREQKDEEEKQNKSKAAFLVTPTSQRPSVKGPGL